MVSLRKSRPHMLWSGCLLTLGSMAMLGGQAHAPAPATPNPGVASTKPGIPSALNLITAASLKGNLSFVSSDALAGRFTPSPGLDVAAEFIASQFRAVGLEPGGDQEYFQMAKMVDRQMPQSVSAMTLQDGSQ